MQDPKGEDLQRAEDQKSRPAGEPASDEIKRQLNLMLESSSFRDSDRGSALLRFVVEKKLELLAKNPEATTRTLRSELSEIRIGAKIFRPNYDASDQNVRIEAGRLRERISRYYETEGSLDPILITLPVGGYVPTWQWRNVTLDHRTKIGPAVPTQHRFPWKKFALALSFLLATVVAGSLYWKRISPTPKPTIDEQKKKTPIVVGFSDNTGGLSETLRDVLASQMDRSPRFRPISEIKIYDTLKLMRHDERASLDGPLGLEVCLRSGSEVLVLGSIRTVGNGYAIVLRADNCNTGDSLASTDAQAENRDAILTALGRASDDLRQKLGESLASIKRFRKPPEKATTSSLPALEAYTKALEVEPRDQEAIEYDKRAIELDPNFALAYEHLGTRYFNLQNTAKATEYLQKAYDLRKTISPCEQVRVEAKYYTIVTREVELANRRYRDWAEDCYGWDDTDPEVLLSHKNRAYNYMTLGQYDPARLEGLQFIFKRNNDPTVYGNLEGAYIALGRLDDAKTLAQDVQDHPQLDGSIFRLNRYLLAFLQSDETGMRNQLTWAKRKRQAEDQMLSSDSDTNAYYGRFAEARQLSGQAVAVAIRDQNTEAAAGWKVNEGLREAEIGNRDLAREDTSAALNLSNDSRDVKATAALTLARAGDLDAAQTLAKKLGDDFNLDTMMQKYSLPTIRAAIELEKGNPNEALRILEITTTYELGSGSFGSLYPAYVRGLAYMKAGHPQLAVTEFQKLVNNRGIVLNFVSGSLAHLQLARAQVESGERDAARKSYADFFVLWKGADPDIPILKEAQAEFAKLK